MLKSFFKKTSSVEKMFENVCVGRGVKRSETVGQLAAGKLITEQNIKLPVWCHQGTRRSAGHM